MGRDPVPDPGVEVVVVALPVPAVVAEFVTAVPLTSVVVVVD